MADRKRTLRICSYDMRSLNVQVDMQTGSKLVGPAMSSQKLSI
jgi:hypothetical protein